MERKGHIEDANRSVNLRPANYPHLYVCNAASQVLIYKGNDFKDLTGMVETNRGSICFIRKLNEEKIVIPTVCQKAHCPALPVYHCVSSFFCG